MPTAEALLKQARLALAELETPTLDARLLLQHVSGLGHADLVAEPDLWIAADVAKAFQALVARRMAYEPVSRILGVREFYGRAFQVTADVLDPRGDTEVLVEASLALLPQDLRLRLLDLGTGSGILAATLLCERPLAEAVAVDLSEAALAVARTNADVLGVGARFHGHEGSWFDGVTGRFDAIVSNPPYIPQGDIAGLEPDVRDYDPHLALAGGADGLSCYRAIAQGAGAHLVPDGFVAVEIGAGQARDVISVFSGSGLALASQHRDLGGHVRVLVFRQDG
jgi:release factor glutamine methyltransferase